MNWLWFLLALSAGLGDSWSKASQNWSVSLARHSKPAIIFGGNIVAFAILFSISYFVIGLPELKSGFWTAVLITGVLNSITFPIFLRAYELGEFSSVYSMILLTPVFLVFTSFLFLGETPSAIGIFGVALTIIGLYIIGKNHGNSNVSIKNFASGNILGILVAIIWSISINFDKLAAFRSDQFFAPAVGSAVLAAVSGTYLISRFLFGRGGASGTGIDEKSAAPKISFFSYLSFIAVGTTLALSGVLHNSALLFGPASYTIAIKRTGVLWGVIWGRLFFKENNISKKLLGAAIAVAGVVAILFA